MNENDIYEYEDLVCLYGNPQTIAAAMGVDPSRISRWKSEGIPPAKQLELMRVIDGSRALLIKLNKGRRMRDGL